MNSVNKAWFDLIDSGKSFPLLNAPFVSAWNVTLPENAEPRAVRVSSIKWETLCLLSRTILLNLETFLLKPEAHGNQGKLSVAIGCAQRAIQELREWRERGNLRTWRSKFVPLEIDLAFFETLHASCWLLYEVYSMAQMEEGANVLATGGILLSLIKKAERFADDPNTPAALEQFLGKLVTAIDIGVSQVLVRCAFACKLLPADQITWSEIGYWQQRFIKAKSVSSSAFGQSEAIKDANAELETIRRLSESSGTIENHQFSEPRLETFDFDLHFEFPYKR